MTRNVLYILSVVFLSGGCRHWFDEECTDTDDTGTTTTTVTTGDSDTDADSDSDSDTDADTDTTTSTGDTGSTGTTDTATPCVVVDWYLDADGDGATGFDQVVSACEYLVAGWSQTLPSDCDDTDPLVWTETFWAVDLDGDGHGDPDSVTYACHAPTVDHRNDILLADDCDDVNDLVYPGAHEDDSDLVDNNCDGTVDECAADRSRLWGQYVAPVGSTNVVVSGQRYDALGVELDTMSPLVDGVDGWTVDSSVVGQVTFENDTCMSDLDWPYFSASFTGVGSYSCVGDANPTYTAFGTFTFTEDGVPMATVYVNNWETPTGFPFGYGGGCEVKIQ